MLSFISYGYVQVTNFEEVECCNEMESDNMDTSYMEAADFNDRNAIEEVNNTNTSHIILKKSILRLSLNSVKLYQIL